MVEAVRVGTVFASNGKAYTQWRNSTKRRQPSATGLTGDALEAAIWNVARMFPENVIVA